MEIINVITMKDGAIENISSHIIHTSAVGERNIVSAEAEKEFLKLIYGDNIPTEDIIEEDVNFDFHIGKDGYAYSIVWSHNILNA